MCAFPCMSHMFWLVTGFMTFKQECFCSMSQFCWTLPIRWINSWKFIKNQSPVNSYICWCSSAFYLLNHFPVQKHLNVWNKDQQDQLSPHISPHSATFLKKNKKTLATIGLSMCFCSRFFFPCPLTCYKHVEIDTVHMESIQTLQFSTVYVADFEIHFFFFTNLHSPPHHSSTNP